MKRFSYTQDANINHSLAPPNGYKKHHKHQQRGVLTSREAERKRKMFINYVQVKFQQKNPAIEGCHSGKDYNREQVFKIYYFLSFSKLKGFVFIVVLIVGAEDLRCYF